MRAVAGALVAVLAGLSGVAYAEVPWTVGYNGVLFTCPETGPCDGYSYEGPMTFRLWDDATAGNKVWEETQPDVKLEGGWYHVDLGSQTALGANAFSGPRWLEVQVGSDAPLAPRAVVGSVPFAMTCGDSVTLQGQPPTAFAAASHVHVIGIGDVTGLQAALDGKAPAVHNHDDLYYRKAAVDTALAGKAAVGDTYLKAESDSRYAGRVHGHAIDDVVGLQPALDGKEDAGTCYPKAQVDQMVAGLQAQIDALKVQTGKTCPADMVQVGDFCVERYESSLWAKKVDDGKPIDCAVLQAAVDEAVGRGWTEADIYKGYDGTQPDCLLTVPPALCSYRQYGSPPGCNSDTLCDDYPEAFPDSGNWTKPLYSCAIRGVMPSRSMTWFQAEQACVNAGKHMITNGEWQAAVAGTPDTTACNTNSAGPNGWSWKTGHGTCKSATGVEDMIGNLWEWVDLWGQAGPVNTSFAAGASVSVWPSTYGDGGDLTWNINGSPYSNGTGGWTTGLPFAPLRGGGWDSGAEAGAFAFNAKIGPSHRGWYHGARCARGL